MRADPRVEADEAFYLDLSNPVGITIARARGIGTIFDEDRFTAVEPAPVAFALLAPSPNPARGAAAIRYELPRACRVRGVLLPAARRRLRPCTQAGRRGVAAA